MEANVTITVTHPNGKSDAFVSAPRPKTKDKAADTNSHGDDYVEIRVTHPDGSMTLHRSSPTR
jgi:hypothetical protein